MMEEPNESMTVRVLREHCKRLGLKVRGTKSEVWARLKHHLRKKPPCCAEEKAESESDWSADDPVVEPDDDVVESESELETLQDLLDQVMSRKKRIRRQPERFSPTWSDRCRASDDSDSNAEGISIDSSDASFDSDDSFDFA